MTQLEKYTFFRILLFCGTIHLILLLFSQTTLFIGFSFFIAILLSVKFKDKPTLLFHWVNPFIILYNQSYVLHKIIIGNSIPSGLEYTILLMSYFSFYTFNIIYILLIKDHERSDTMKNIEINKYVYRTFFILLFGCLLIYLGNIFLNISYLTSKRSVVNFVSESTYLVYLFALSSLFILLIFYDLFTSKDKKKDIKSKLIIYGLLFLTIFLVVGERDLLFTYGIGIFFMYSYFQKRFLIKEYYFFILLILFIGPYSQLLKSFLLQNEVGMFNMVSFSEQGFDDFMTVGANIVRTYEINQLRSVDKFLILDDIGNTLKLTMNSGRWYNLVFLGRGLDMTGYGFSLELTGFLDFSYPGIIIVYSIIAAISAGFYNKLTTNYLGLSFLVGIISLLIYIQRQDLAYFLNYCLKFVLIPYIFFSLFRNKRTYNIYIKTLHPNPSEIF